MEQTTSRLLLVKPSNFGFNTETAASNNFQERNNTDVRNQAEAEFIAFQKLLENEKIKPVIFDDAGSRSSPDAVFPNNWITMHHDGTVITYPMHSPLRRNERREDIIFKLEDEYGFYVKEVICLADIFEKEGKFLEGTGSVVFDHTNRYAYMSKSVRSHPEPFEKLLSLINYNGFVFHSDGPGNMPVYHTNVLMSVGKNFVTVCLHAIPSKEERNKLAVLLQQGNRQLIEISMEQMSSFAGNMLEVCNTIGDPYVLLSATALSSLKTAQKKMLERHATMLPASIPVIEKHGGGSIRCMVAEIFLPEIKKRFKVIRPETAAEFERYFDLRYRILRAPWNQPRGTERDDGEENSLHFMAIDGDGNLAGVSRLQFNDKNTAQVRYMAVEEKFRGKGIGKLLMKEMEQKALASGYIEIFLQAREIALPFYLSLGYTVVEKTFLLFDEVQHYSMKKKIGKSSK